MNYYSVFFKQNGKRYYFSSELDIENNVNVIVETERGIQLAKVDRKVPASEIEINLDNIKEIMRVATDEDYDQYMSNLKDSAKALDYARELVNKGEYNMNIIDAYFTFDKKQLIFNFISDERVDFRELVKEIAAKFKTRIELHQIGVRDKSKIIGGIGSCGQQLCCSRFLNDIDTISINMAKNQNISLNPMKINGLCGRLLCCLSYEDDTYTENRESLPKIGEYVTTKDGKGKVISLDVLNKKYSVQIDNDVYEYERN